MERQDLNMHNALNDSAKRLYDNNPRHAGKNIDDDLHWSALTLFRRYDLCTGTSWGILRGHDVVSGSNACK